MTCSPKTGTFTVFKSKAGSIVLVLGIFLSFHLIVADAKSDISVPFVIGGDPRVEPGDFLTTEFAGGLDFPFGMQVLPGGSLLVAISRPNSPGAGLFDSTGELLRLDDADDDGVADGPGSILFSGLTGPITSLRLSGDLVFVAHARTISVLRQGTTPADPFTLEGSIDFSIPPAWNHGTFTLAVRETPGQPDMVELFFNVGSKENNSETTDVMGLGGLIGGTVDGDSIYRVTVDNTGVKPTISGLTQIAKGLRNPFGMAFEPGTGDLFFEDNGIDGLVDGNEPLSADELNRIRADDIGGAVEDFGFPHNYIEYRTGTEIGSGGIDPLVVFQPIPSPDGAESEGPAEIAFAPSLFPTSLSKGIFVGFHGKFSLAGVNNEENPLVFVDLNTLEYFHFISNIEPGIGHIDSLLSAGDSLFIADLTTADGLSTAGTGVIYQIRPSQFPVPALSIHGIVLLTAIILSAGTLRRARAYSKHCPHRSPSGGRSFLARSLTGER